MVTGFLRADPSVSSDTAPQDSGDLHPDDLVQIIYYFFFFEVFQNDDNEWENILRLTSSPPRWIRDLPFGTNALT